MMGKTWRNQMCKVAVIDTGIDIGNKYLPLKHFHGICIQKQSNHSYCVTYSDEDQTCIQDHIGHGTAVCGIILSHNSDADIFMVKLFDWDSLQADEDLLCFALEYILNHVECDIINMSLGLCLSENNKLYELCQKLKGENKILVSAFDNNGAISYPAAFDTVIGVTSGDDCYRNDDFYIVNNIMVNVSAKGRPQRLVWLHDQMLVGSGNSYACAHITGILSMKIKEVDARHALKKLAKGTLNFGKENTSLFINPVMNYKKAVAFPFNKEMHSIVRFQDMLCFELLDIYDLKYSAHVGASTNNILKDCCKKNYIIRNITEIDWDSFDTFILGHTDELLQIIDMPNFKQKLISDILSHGKYLYAFEDLSSYKLPDNTAHLLFYPKVTMKDVPTCPFGKLYRQGKPVLGIFGTSSRQGKFTIQLRIRKGLLERGYTVSQIGTEPSALLFGMDFVFPIGYQSCVEINRRDTVVYLNNALHEVDMETDIIIVGGQSGTVIRDEGNLDNYNFTQVDFLYATQPDAVVLCVNVYDEIEIIDRTIRFIESATGCKIIALVVYPFHYPKEDSSYQQLVLLETDEYEIYKSKLFAQFHLPVYLMNNNSHVDWLIEQIIDYFSCP